MNVSCGHDAPYPLSQAVLRVGLMLPTILFGVCSNGMSIGVFCNKSMRKSFINWFLLALAISDQLILICSFCMLSLPVIAEYFHHMQLMAFTTHLTRWVYPVSLMSQTCSVYLTVMVSFYRYIGVCYPFKARRSSKKPKLFTIFAVVTFSIGFNLVRWAEVTTAECYSTTFNATSIVLKTAVLNNNALYRLLYRVWGYFTIMFMIPFGTLVYINICIVHSLHIATRTRRIMSLAQHEEIAATPQTGICDYMQTAGISPALRLNEGSPVTNEGVVNGLRPSASNILLSLTPGVFTPRSGGHNTPHVLGITTPMLLQGKRCKRTRDGKETGITTMLVVLVAIFLLCNSLPFINNCMEIAGGYGFDWIESHTFLVLVELGNLLVAINASVNSIIYAIFSTKFRHAALIIIKCQRRTKFKTAIKLVGIHDPQ